MYALIIDIIVSLLLGSMVFFAAVVAPSAFQSLEPEQTSQFLRKIFPRYYLWGIVFSVAALAVCLFHSPKGSVLMVLVLAGFIYSRQILMPKINELRETYQCSESPQDKARFDALHRRSVIINVAQMLMLVTIVIAMNDVH